MAQSVQVILTDDIDGGPASETVTFAVDGVTYEIDLNEENAADLRKTLDHYTASARRVGKNNARGNRGQGTKTTRDYVPSAVREWAAANGHKDVPERGRIPGAILEAYKAAGN